VYPRKHRMRGNQRRPLCSHSCTCPSCQGVVRVMNVLNYNI
jgi:hypothetical protein